ncbi:hypothetical protein MTBLM1_20199 [Rhodospirillaceae bacterium LM-1]|nr:hypothetical protein MTBLM1_20199 [Rhodospirillaceae bacterium LM-1]
MASSREKEVGGGWFSLSAPVGREAANRPRDVLRVETLLGQTGHYDINRFKGPLGLWGSLSDRAVKDFQQENDLKVDGLLKPDGPTILTLKSKVEDIFKSWDPPSPQEVTDHHDSLARGDGGRLTFGRPPLQMARAGEVDAEISAANRRTQAYLSGYADNQGLDQAAAREIAAGDDLAIKRYRHLIERMAASDPKRAHAFAWGIVDHLPDDGLRRAFLGTDLARSRPVGIRREDWGELYWSSVASNDSLDQPLDLRDDEADPMEGGDDAAGDGDAQGGGGEESSGGEQGLDTAENNDASALDENAFPQQTDEPQSEEGKQQLKEALEASWKEHDQLQEPINETKAEIERLEQEIEKIRNTDPRAYSGKEDYKEFTDTDSVAGKEGWEQIDKKYMRTLEHQMVGMLGLSRERLTEGELKAQIKAAEAKLDKLERQRSLARSAAEEYERRFRTVRGKQ